MQESKASVQPAGNGANQALVNPVDKLFSNLRTFLTTYELFGDNTENEPKWLQRLKILSKISQNHVQFKVLNPEQGIVLLHTKEDYFPNDIYINKLKLNKIMQVRSSILQLTDDTFKLLNYSIPRVQDVTNEAFLKLMQDGKVKVDSEGDGVTVEVQPSNTNTNKTHVSYEGPVILCDFVNEAWRLRTTGHPDAFSSYYNSPLSHGTQFAKTCELKKYGGEVDWSKTMEKLTQQLPNAYFTFVLVTPMQRYLCKYTEFENDCEIFLIDARDRDTQESLDLTKQTLFKLEEAVEYDFVLKNLSEQDEFKNQALGLQGYVLRTPEGELFRTYTGAYRQGIQIIPRHENPFWSALECYMKRNLVDLCNVNDITGDNREQLQTDCATVFNSICNVLAYTFIVFTDFHVSEETRKADDGSDETYYKKSYTKRNGILYESMKTQAHTKRQKTIVDAYFNMIAKIQGYAANSKRGFINREYIASDVGTVLRFQANKVLDYKRLKTLVLGYKEFVSFMIMMVDRYNLMLRDQHTENKKLKKTKQEKPFQLNQFKNKLDENLDKVLEINFASTAYNQSAEAELDDFSEIMDVKIRDADKN